MAARRTKSIFRVTNCQFSLLRRIHACHPSNQASRNAANRDRLYSGGVWDSRRRYIFSGGVISLQSGRDRCYAAAILIGLGFVSSFFGKTTFSTPSLYSAATFSGLTAVGKANDRLKVPYSRSMR